MFEAIALLTVSSSVALYSMLVTPQLVKQTRPRIYIVHC